MSTEVALRETQSAPVSGFEMKPRSMEEAMHFCEIMAKSELVPKCYQDKPGNIMVAIQMGSELGMTPMRALRSISVINGRASMWGDDMMAMVLASPVCEYIDESESNDKEGVCKAKRKGSVEHVSRFTLEDAKRAGLLGKQGPWTSHTGRMLKLRARGFALRDKFADVLAGLVTSEEATDIPSGATMPEVSVDAPPSLKDRLRAKVAIDAPTAEPEPLTVSEVLAAPDAGIITNQPPELDHYQGRIRTAKDEAEAKQRYEAVPEELRQDCFGVYTDTLKKMGARKK